VQSASPGTVCAFFFLLSLLVRQDNQAYSDLGRRVAQPHYVSSSHRAIHPCHLHAAVSSFFTGSVHIYTGVGDGALGASAPRETGAALASSQQYPLACILCIFRLNRPAVRGRERRISAVTVAHFLADLSLLALDDRLYTR